MFKDHFSAHAASYSVHRPAYPDALFTYLAERAPDRQTAWDCATGNGQAALGLASHFAQVWATDASAAQIGQAMPHERIAYGVAPAEASGLQAGTADLVTVAQSLHWFDLPQFYAEARRVLRPQGVLAVWCYNLFHVNPDMDRVVEDFYENIVGQDWPPERRHVEDGYRGLPFPFEEELEIPRFAIEKEMSVEEVLDYIRTWSAVQRYMRRESVDPVEVYLAPQLTRAGGGKGARLQLRWPITMRLGMREK